MAVAARQQVQAAPLPLIRLPTRHGGKTGGYVLYLGRLDDEGVGLRAPPPLHLTPMKHQPAVPALAATQQLQQHEQAFSFYSPRYLAPPRPPPMPQPLYQQQTARFQQRQLQEKEAKLLRMLESQQERALQRVSGRGSAGSSTSSTSSTSSSPSTGKVRLMFEESRRGAPAPAPAGARRGVARSGPAASTGWDRSYPLDPLSKRTTSISAGRPTARGAVPPKPVPARSKQELDVSVRSFRSNVRDTNANQVLTPNDDLAPMFGKLANVGLRNGVNNNNAEHDTHDAPLPPRKPLVKSLAEPKYRVAPAKRAEAPRANPPAPAVPARSVVARRSTPPSPGHSSANSSNTPSSAASPEPHVQKVGSASSFSRGSAPSSPSHAAPAAPVPQGPVPPGMAECSLCSRRFAEDRIAKHEEICRKTKSKKRKTFDPVKMRVQGTEVEAYIRKSGKKVAAQPKKSAAADTKKNSNWRKKHEEFIESIRAAKQVQAHIAAGGKASDLPPPKPMDTSDYVQCPHCNRKFSEGAAERHVPRCANIKSNKPAPTKSPPRKR